MSYRVISVRAHATGLRLPSHLAISDDGQVFVSEFGGGMVRDVTESGDYRNLSRGVYASELKHPGGLLFYKGRLLVADSGAERVYQVREGKKVSEMEVLSEGIPHPYGLVEFEGRLFTSFSNNRMVGMATVSPGERFNLESAFVSDFPVVITSEPYPTLAGCGGSWPTQGAKGMLLLGHRALGAIFDVTLGGTFDRLRESRFAWGLTEPLGMTFDVLDEDLYIVEQRTGVIKRIDAKGGYSRFAAPLIAGFREPSCIRFTGDGTAAYVCDRSWGTVFKLDLEHRA